MKNYYPSYYHLNNQSWKDFYLKMVYYLSKLEELYGIPYISSEYFNPESFYKLYINSQKSALNMAMNFASDSGQMDIVELMVKKGADSYNSAIIYAAKGGHMDIPDGIYLQTMSIKKIEEKGLQFVEKNLPQNMSST